MVIMMILGHHMLFATLSPPPETFRNKMRLGDELEGPAIDALIK
jgi:hypothetical protein